MTLAVDLGRKATKPNEPLIMILLIRVLELTGTKVEFCFCFTLQAVWSLNRSMTDYIFWDIFDGINSLDKPVLNLTHMSFTGM